MRCLQKVRHKAFVYAHQPLVLRQVAPLVALAEDPLYGRGQIRTVRQRLEDEVAVL